MSNDNGLYLGNRRAAEYQPLTHVLLAAISGVLIDRFFPVPLLVWLIAAPVLIAAWMWMIRAERIRLASATLLLAIAATAASWHDLRRNFTGPDDVSGLASNQPRPVCLRGVISTQPRWIAPTPRETGFSVPRGFRSRLDLRVHAIRDQDEFLACSGKVEVFVDGQLSGFYAGQQIELFGQIRKVGPPTNPGQFDFQEYFRRQGISCWMNVGHPDQIHRLPRRGDWLSTGMSRLRGYLDYLLWKYVDADHAPLASAMLLGNRHQLDELRRQQFLITGTVHLLAISGLHVGILAGLMLWLPRLGISSRRSSLCLAVLVAIAFAWIVEFRPPVTRATILITVFCYCKWTGRQAFSVNTLSLAALVVLLVNPTDVFSSGAQLSFLAVLCLMLFASAFARRKSADPIMRLIENSRSWPERWFHLACHRIGLAFAGSAIIWLMTVPLVAHRFHVFAPIALIANPLLLIPIAMALLCGFGVMLTGWVIPPLAVVLGKGCDVSLEAVQQLVNACEGFPLSHCWTSGPSETATLIFYAGFLLFGVYRPLRLPPRWLLTVCLAWFCFGWVFPAWQSRKAHETAEVLSCTFVDVGHGTCVLLQLPGGRTVLYDCGSFGSPNYALRNASSVLWHHQISHLDAVILSHADSDHFNALPQLCERFSIGQMIVSSPMSNGRNPAIQDLLGHFHERGIPLQTVCAGDQLDAGDDVTLTVMGPAESGNGQSDNSNSIVLSIAYGDFEMLLPGDLEGEGLDDLISSPRRQYDLVMTPHHGRLGDRAEDFFRWARPACLVTSADDRHHSENLQAALQNRNCRLFHTAVDGAVRIESNSKDYVIRSWLSNPW